MVLEFIGLCMCVCVFMGREMKQQGKQKPGGGSLQSEGASSSPAAQSRKKVHVHCCCCYSHCLFTCLFVCVFTEAAAAANTASAAATSSEERTQGMTWIKHIIASSPTPQSPSIDVGVHVRSYIVSCSVCFRTLMQSKQKKIRDRYADQDEEERQMRMDILAVSHMTTVYRRTVFHIV